MGLYGNVIVEPADPDYWGPAHRELCVTLDDVLLEDGQIAPFSRLETNYSAMGRFGDTLLIAGEPELGLTAKRGEVVRVYLTNTANTRVFKVALPGARMKLVGGDSGRVEHEEFVEDVVLAPSERAVVDVLFEQPGELVLEHRTPEKTYRLGTVAVADERAVPDLASRSRSCAVTASSRPSASGSPRGWPPSRTRRWPSWPRWTSTPSRDPPSTSAPCTPRSSPRSRPLPELRHEAAAAGDDLHLPHAPRGRVRGAGPLPELRHEAAAGAAGGAGRRPRAPRARPRAPRPRGARPPRPRPRRDRRHRVGGRHGRRQPDHHPANTRWKLIDRSTEAANHAIQWQFTVGDRVKIRLVNEMDSDHPMHHPFHIHGAGRFLVMARDGEPEPNLVWSDTVLVRTGEIVDILLDVTNPGHWMAHCHIAEHHESGMMFSFDVAPAEPARHDRSSATSSCSAAARPALALGYFLGPQDRASPSSKPRASRLPPGASAGTRCGCINPRPAPRQPPRRGRFPGEPGTGYPDTATRSSPTLEELRSRRFQLCPSS
jgi:FtsP/CotA-like multicopper oxidase with cupredoxin domain